MADQSHPRQITVTLTTDEVRALLLASIFGGPGALEEARRKLIEAEEEAEHVAT